MAVNRIAPQLPASSMKTYGISAPRSTHTRPGTCAEAECPNYLNGWRVDASVLTEQNFADLRAGGWHWSEMSVTENERWLVFPAGQRCFTQHRVSLEREPFYVVRGGDWRGDPRGIGRRAHTADTWVDDFATHQDTLATRLQQG